MRAILLSLLCWWLAWQEPGVRAAAANPAAVPDHGPYQIVGSVKRYSRPRLPVAMVASLRLLLTDDPMRWYVLRVDDLPGQRRRVLQITTERGGYAVLTRLAGSWVNLSAPGGAPYINKVLDPLRPADLQNPKKVEDYFHAMVFLKKYDVSLLIAKRRSFVIRHLPRPP